MQKNIKKGYFTEEVAYLRILIFNNPLREKHGIIAQNFYKIQAIGQIFNILMNPRFDRNAFINAAAKRSTQ